MQPWVVAVALSLAVLAGCSGPEPRFPPWTESHAPGGPQRPADGTFQFVDVSGTLRQVGAERDHGDCAMASPNADVDEARHKLILDDETMREWRPNATLIVRSRVYQYEQSSCNGPGLTWPRDGLRYWPDGATMGVSMHIDALYGGPAIGPSFRVLEEGVPYHHRVLWQEVDPSTGEEREFVLDATFLYHGTWSWADAEVGDGQTHWAG